MRSPRFLFACLLTSLTGFFGMPAIAQVIPDQTLGSESSVVTPNVEVRGAQAELIEGGAARGSNLFHSFSDFGIPEGGRVYFSNPIGVDSILSRVTGNNSSPLFGTLGVRGAADLFFINPNGILFGPQMNLDVEGSFHATTAESISLEEGSFNAVFPEQDQLLSIKPDTSFLNYITENSGSIFSFAKLESGEDLSLSANGLSLRGQLTAGGNMALLSNGAVLVQDSEESPFVAFAVGDLLLQGNQDVSIAAFNHPGSRIVTTGNIITRSSQPIRGDINFFSGEDFRVEKLDESLGDLSKFRSTTPVIRAGGDVSIGEYVGDSLHILAGGSVQIASVSIADPSQVNPLIDRERRGFLRDEIILSNGETIEVDGENQPTLDIRAGISRQFLENSIDAALTNTNSEGTHSTEVLSHATSQNGDILASPSIDVGAVTILGPEGLVLLTNQYSPSQQNDGSIQIGSVQVSRFFDEKASIDDFIVDSRNDINVLQVIDVLSTDGGSILLLAEDAVKVENPLNATSGLIASLKSDTRGQGGNITIHANSLLLNRAILDASSFGIGDAGTILIEVDDELSLQNNSFISNDIGLTGNPEIMANGNSGGINIRSGSLSLTEGSEIRSLIVQGSTGRGGKIFIDASNLLLNDANLRANSLGSGDSGAILLQIEGELSLQNDSSIRSNIGILNDFGIVSEGNSGGIEIRAGDLSIAEASAITSAVEEGSIGNGGRILINVNSLLLDSNSQVRAQVSGRGSAGNIEINARESVNLQGSVDPIRPDENTFITSSLGGSRSPGEGRGNAGDIIIRAREIKLSGAQINSGTFGQGDAGNITLEATDNIEFSNNAAISSSVSFGGVGNGGQVEIDTGSISINDSEILAIVRGEQEFIILGQVVTLPTGRGRAGNIIVNARDDINIEKTERRPGNNFVGIASVVGFNTIGDAGNIDLTAGGRILVQNDASVRSVVETGAVGQAGNIQVQARSVVLNSLASIDSFSAGEGDAGNIVIEANALVALNDSDILAFSEGGSGGNIDISETTLFSDPLNPISQDLTAQNISTERTLSLARNGRVDISATGTAASGTISTNESTFVENDLTELPDALFNPDTLVASSCIVRSENSDATFTIAGSDRPSASPTTSPTSPYPTGTAQTIPTNAIEASENTNHIAEPQAIYRTSDGRFIMSQACDR